MNTGEKAPYRAKVRRNFGGSIERMQTVAEHIIKAKNDGNQVVVVVSAMAGETNRLVGLAQQVDSVPNARELDVCSLLVSRCQWP